MHGITKRGVGVFASAVVFVLKEIATCLHIKRIGVILALVFHRILDFTRGRMSIRPFFYRISTRMTGVDGRKYPNLSSGAFPFQAKASLKNQSLV